MKRILALTTRIAFFALFLVGFACLMIPDGKLQVSVLDQASQDKYAAVAYRIWDEVAVQSPANAKAVNLIKQWQKIK